MKKVITIDLDYQVGELRNAQGGEAVPSNPKITRNLVENIWPTNHPEMGAKKAREWRRIVTTIEKAIEAGHPLVALRADDFDALCKETYACKFPANQAYIVPVLLDELDRVKELSKEESAAALKKLENIEANSKANAEASQQTEKVLEMSQAAKS